jgi:hypothetical protein
MMTISGLVLDEKIIISEKWSTKLKLTATSQTKQVKCFDITLSVSFQNKPTNNQIKQKNIKRLLLKHLEMSSRSQRYSNSQRDSLMNTLNRRDEKQRNKQS